jgi:hypothetical protein
MMLLLLFIKQPSFSYNSPIKHFWGHVDVQNFFLFWYVKLVLKDCPHLSITTCILSVNRFLSQEKYSVRMLKIAASIEHNRLLVAVNITSLLACRRRPTVKVMLHILSLQEKHAI